MPGAKTGLLWTADELANHKFSHSFLIDPIVLRGGINLLHGKRGIGKSHFALTLAACLSERGALWGRYPTHASGAIVYVQADVPAWLTQQRVQMAQKVYSLSNVRFFFPDHFNILSLSTSHELVCEIAQLHPSLIIWDTLRKIHPLDSNSDQVPSLVYGTARELFPKAAHLFIHHDKKTIADQDMLDKEEEFRGSGAWIDDAHTGIHMVEVGRNRMMLYFTKTNACEEQQPLPLTLNLETLMLYSAPENAHKLAEWWRKRYPSGNPGDLEKYLLASFVGGPRVARQIAQGIPDERVEV